MRGGILILTLIAVASCDDGGTDVGQTANLVREGTGAWTNCKFGICDFVGDARNIGEGCAEEVRAVIKFFDTAGVQQGPSEDWKLLPSFRVIRPGEAFTYKVISSETIMDVTASSQVEFSWTDTKC